MPGGLSQVNCVKHLQRAVSSAHSLYRDDVPPSNVAVFQLYPEDRHSEGGVWRQLTQVSWCEMAQQAGRLPK